MAELQASQFKDFFHQLYGKDPFPWQENLATKVCSEAWPRIIDLPTASGKTACIDIALFSLALRGNEAPRRIFFVVDRRLIVNQAYRRICRVRDRLMEALRNEERSVLRQVAERLCRLANGHRDQDEEEVGEAPLLVSEMRGGAFRDETWIKNPLQPTVVASTVDQVGSRLLFRGYGVSESAWPLHAALIGNDALIFLDEAHCSRAFAQTLKRVEQYRSEKWASRPILAPFHFVQMTATPAEEEEKDSIFTLTGSDRDTPTLQKRLQAVKPARLVEPIKGRKDDTENLADELVKQALDLAKTTNAKRVVIFANRVKTAKQTYRQLVQRLDETAAEVTLIIGSMRAVDRDDLHKRRLERLEAGNARSPEDSLTFVVSTQCLEVGADFDFDVLVSECASIDALQQRFGRLNRLGDFERARGAIVIGSWQIQPKQPDPVYGEALSKTWEWLKEMAGESGEINVGIESRNGDPPTIQEQLRMTGRTGLRLIGEDAPFLLPAHVDMLAQTNPAPEPSPSIELFLHGPKRGAPDVSVVWRGDLEGVPVDQQIEIIKLNPPSSRETMPVAITAFKKWFAGETNVTGAVSDVEAGETGDSEIGQQREIYAIVWSGDQSRVITTAREVKPGQTLVLRASLEGWDALGYLPDGAVIDVGDRAALEARNAVSLRLHPELIKQWPETPARQPLSDYVAQPDAEQERLESYLEEYRRELAESQAWPFPFLDKLRILRRKQFSAYPGLDTPYVLRARQGRPRQGPSQPVFLEDHTAHVKDAVGRMASNLFADLQYALTTSAYWHDHGKADVRYQAWLRGGDRMSRFMPRKLAKSGNDVLLKQQTVGLPKGFRHELVSLMFAEKSPESGGESWELILHLIASHHGRCRPFAPVVLDDAAECVTHCGISLCRRERVENAPHRLDRGISGRFWRLTAKYGWWGLAYCEALLRLADWEASGKETAEVSNDD